MNDNGNYKEDLREQQQVLEWEHECNAPLSKDIEEIVEESLDRVAELWTD